MVEMDLLLALRSHARYRSDQLAIRYEDRELTYGALAARVSLLLGSLRARGCQPGDRIGVATYQGTLPVELYLAAQAGGMQPVMLSWTLGQALPEVAAALHVRHLFAGAEAAALPNLARSADLGPIWDVHDRGDDAGGFVQPATPPDDEWVPRRQGDDISGIQFSAGSTGLPKAVLRSVRADVWDAWHKMLAFHGREGDQWLCITPMNLGVLAGALRPMLLFGGSLVVLRQFSVAATVAAIDAGATIVPLQTPHWQELLRYPEVGRLAASGVRTLVATGQRTPVGLAKQVHAVFPRARMVVNYGTTESSTVAVLSADDPAFGTPSCVGKPLPTIEVEVVDTADGEPLYGPQRGEIRLRGPSVVPGYDPSVGTPATNMRDGWFFTGDAGYWDESGNLYVVDRLADVFDVTGQRVYPGEVQEELFRLPEVKDVAVAGVLHGTQPRATAFVVPHQSPLDTAGALAAIQRVSDVPFEVREVERLPKTLGGKLDRAALKRGTWE